MSRLVVSFLAFAVASCSVSPEIPDGAQISCNDNTQCPDGYLCNPNTGLCISEDAPDTQSPRITSAVAVAPEIARADTSITVTFEVDEYPEVAELYFEDRGVRRDLERTSTAPDTTLTFVYEPSGTEAQTAHPLYVHLEDAAQNPLFEELGESVEFDFVDPEVVGDISLTVMHAADNPLRVAQSFPIDLSSLPRAAGDGATLTAAFATSEPLDPATQIVVGLVGGSSAPAFSLVSQVGTGVVYEAAVSSDADEVTYDLRVSLEDTAGNTSVAVVSPAVTVDLTPPSQPDVASDDVIVYERVPWGSDTTNGMPLFSVTGASGAVDGGSLVFVTATDVSANVLGVGLAGADGGFAAVSLPAVDRPVVHIVAVDAAGNASPVSTVDQVTWTATLGDKIPGSSLENFNVFLSSPHFCDDLLDAAAFELGAANDLATIDCETGCASPLAGEVGLGHWQPDIPNLQRYDPTTFTPIESMAIAYDPGRDVVVLFGGQPLEIGSSLQNTVWEWDGETWNPVVVGGVEPEPRMRAAMAYHWDLGKVVMFGGYDLSEACSPSTNSACGDTWTWDGSDWVELGFPGPTPSPRHDHILAYHHGRGRMILSGGYGADSAPTDTWALYCPGGVCSWQNLLLTRDFNQSGAAAYDRADDRLVGFGGCETWGYPCSDPVAAVWTLGAGKGWAEATADSGLARQIHAMVFDEARDEILAWGGQRYLIDPLTCGRPWSLVGLEFQCQQSAVAYGIRDQVERGFSYAAYRATTEETIIVGPQQGSLMHRWNGGAGGRPAQTFIGGFGVAAGGSDRVIVEQVNFQPATAPGFPGFATQTPSAVSASGRGWTCATGDPGTMIAKDNNDPAAPDQRFDTYIQLRKTEQAMVIYDCAWEYDLPNGDYLVRVVAGDSRAIGRAQTVRLEGQTVIDGATDNAEMWLDTTVPVTVADGQLTLSAGNVETRLAFVEILRPTSVRDIAVSWLAGGVSDDYQPGVHLPLYNASGSSPTHVTIATDTPVTGSVRNNLSSLVGVSPSRRWELRVVFDNFNDAYPGTFDSWCVNLPEQSYCDIVDIDLHRFQGAVGVIDLTGVDTLADIGDGVSVTFDVSGSLITYMAELSLAPLSFGTRDGVALYGYDGGAWQELATAPSATLTGPGWLQWTSANTAEAVRFLSGQSRQIGFAVAPIGTNGHLQPGAEVATDYVEMVVRYRISALPQ